MMGLPETYPAYSVTSQGIGRQGNPMNDVKLCQVAACVRDRDCGYDERAVRLAFEIIQRYAKWPLAKFIFLLPYMQKLIETKNGGGAAVLITEELEVVIYKGVENILFEIYEELGDGEVMTDDTVRRKMVSIVS